jgi:uncharacterized membrane protein YfcA
MSPAITRLILGTIAIAFTLHYWARNWRNTGNQPRHFGPVVGIIAAATSGFTSFIAHAGGPPLGMYLLRRGLDKTALVATTAVFFTIVNYVKLVPYAWLGQLESGTLKTSLALMPLAPVSIMLGVWLHNRVSERLFYSIAYSSLFFVGIKLMWDGLTQI